MCIEKMEAVLSGEIILGKLGIMIMFDTFGY